ncbi:MAG: cyclic nucleotide-binding domain-containing protein [Spirochaetae bacterium HGW-Spirochaetae-8]|jgi:CRP-like cAMP-binding protein|nr:MAG: cyclic nucleotide-binding domain-containing protein [Spirochaetae bacterium HGW-Spirochaetae-8]
MSLCTLRNDFFIKHSMFGGLTAAELEIIRPSLDERHYPKGTRILTQGEPNNTVYFIFEGEISIQKHPDEAAGPVRQIAVLHPGDSFGEMELIDIQPCAASVVCLTDSIVIALTNRDLYQLSKEHLQTYTMIIMNLARDISRRLRSTDELLALAAKNGSKSQRP